MRLIDADALKEVIKNDIYVVDYGEEGAIYGMFWSGIEYEIDEQPTVKQKTGKWIRKGMSINCSVCKKCSWSLCFEDTVRQFNYCPHCGAKMEVQE